MRLSTEERERIGRWLDHASAMARTVERHLAAERAATALADQPELTQRVRAAILAEG